jgi:anti-sigma regulatory factor (Ser/Thr protein kinase)
MAAFCHVLEVEPAVASLLRRAFRRWLAGWPSEEVDDLVLALNEAVANVVDHAYLEAEPDRYRKVEVLAEQVRSPDGERRVRTEVTDSGCWRPIPANPGHRGRGLLMMRACTDSLDVQSTPAGTRVSMLSRPVRQAENPALPNSGQTTRPSAGARFPSEMPAAIRRSAHSSRYGHERPAC